MSADRLFGPWDGAPENGYSDEAVVLWNHLAAQNVGKPEFQPNSGLTQRRGEITMLWDLYRRARPQVVVEIGVAQGGTFASWCVLGRPDATIIGIDRDVNDCRPRAGDQISPHISHYPVERNTTNGGGMYALGRNNQVIKPINGWSYNPAVVEELILVLAGRKIDWLWTDSSHEASMFEKEFNIYWPMVADGGVFCTHDIHPSTHPDVTKWKVWDRIKRSEPYSMMMEFKGGVSDDSYGIGVLIK